MTAPSLSRNVFKTSRLAEFSSKKELVNQTGHAVEDWPLVVLKELVDNALDSTEEAGIAPAIQISVSQKCITIADNGSGIAPETFADIIDYTVRVSSREAYVSPTRGAQGNALKTILAMPFALDGECGETVIESQGVAHRIGFSIDRIRQEPRISRVCETSPVKTGVQVTVRWPDSASSILDAAQARFLQIAENYTWVNPHMTLTAEWDRSGETTRRTIAATNPAWKKWRPSHPTSPHWYDVARLARLPACNIAYAQDRGALCRTVADFVREFRGLALSADKEKFANTLRRHGATEDEIAFLMEGQRVELNAMTSDQFIAFVGSKLTEAGIAKIVPPKDQLDEAYRLFARSKRVKAVVEEAILALDDDEFGIPDDLSDLVRDYLSEHPDMPWEDAVRHSSDSAP